MAMITEYGGSRLRNRPH